VRPPDDDERCDDGDEAEFVACINCSIRDDRDNDIDPRSSIAPSVGIAVVVAAAKQNRRKVSLLLLHSLRYRAIICSL